MLRWLLRKRRKQKGLNSTFSSVLCDDEGNARFLEAAKSKGKVSPAPALAKSSQQQKNATAPGTNDVGEGSPRTSQNLPLSPERPPRTKKRKEAKEGQ